MKKGTMYTRTFGALAAATMIFNAVTPAVFAEEFTEDTVILETSGQTTRNASLYAPMKGTLRTVLEKAAQVQTPKEKSVYRNRVDNEMDGALNVDILTNLNGMLNATTTYVATAHTFNTTLDLNINLNDLLGLSTNTERQTFANIVHGIANVSVSGKNQLENPIKDKEFKIEVAIPQGISYGFKPGTTEIDAIINKTSSYVDKVTVSAGTEKATITLKLNADKTVDDWKHAIHSLTNDAGTVKVSLPIHGTYTSENGVVKPCNVSAKLIEEDDLFDLSVKGTSRSKAYIKLKQDQNQITQVNILESVKADPVNPVQPGGNNGSNSGSNGSGSNNPNPSKPSNKPSAVKHVAMLRLFNPKTGEHLYTADENEKNVLTANHGWNYEGIGWMAPEESATPVYRVYNPNSGDHHYTTDKNEYDTLQAKGWKGEGIGWYSDDDKTVEVHRLYNSNLKIGTHHYTQSVDERDQLVAGGEWIHEGLAWHAR